MNNLADKVAFITGGVSGIGLGIAHALLSADMKLVLTYRRENHLHEARDALAKHLDRVLFLQVDVADRAGMQAAADRAEQVFGRVHVLCNNAGIGIRTTVRDATYNDWDWAVSVNLMGVVNGIRCFLPKIRAHGEGGHIVTTASIAGLALPPASGVYSATKYAAVAIMEALRGEIAAEGIGVSVFCPGLVKSGLIDTEAARPERYAEEGRLPDVAQRRRFAEEIMAHGMEPAEAGRHVLEGIRCNRLYILSHPEFAALVRARFEAILSSFPSEQAIPPERVRAESYTLTNPTFAAAAAEPIRGRSSDS